MSAIECPDCKSGVSSEAETCVFCGYVFKPKKSADSFMLHLLISTLTTLCVLFVVVILLHFTGILNHIIKATGLIPAYKCDDEDSVNTALRVVNEKFLKERFSSSEISRIQAKFNSIRTLSQDNDAGTCVCRADLVLINPHDGGEKEVTADYTTYKIKDGLSVEVRLTQPIIF
ncbi:MAG: hypothetical protein LBF40_09870 [Deltaproteobacteria bacterium]|jgi:hypothetical protein|nr:hypothetical protein [Deltaproteobacteria bacterium]